LRLREEFTMNLQLITVSRQYLFKYWGKYIQLWGAECGCFLLQNLFLKKNVYSFYSNKCLLVQEEGKNVKTQHNLDIIISDSWNTQR
jgi:hypothetical protein